ncbi:MAG: hypothetical protein AAFX06_15260 [Planctomycetota bacterium]
MDRHHDNVIAPPPVPIRIRTARDGFVQPGAPPRVPLRQPALSPRIREATTSAASGHRRAGLGVSVLLHAALLLLIAVLMAPIDLKDGGEHVLVLRLGVETMPEQNATEPFSVSASDVAEADIETIPEPAPIETPAAESAAASPPPQQPQPVDDAGAPPSQTSESGSHSGANASTGSTGSSSNAEGASGSFFGISAEGHEFVYILDRSSSMRGSRYQRAASELIRSVSELSEQQSFYVFLFSKNTVRLFGTRAEPACVPATEENKERLRRWLGKTAPDGNTDPRDALYQALKLQPSAVFMLSDGEFTEDAPVRIAGSLTGSSHELVGNLAQLSSRGLAPIHTVAYEDPKSKVNLQRLATLTGGTFRYVKFRPRTSKQMITEVRAALEQPPSLPRSGELDKLVLELTRSRVTKKYLIELHWLLSQDAEMMADVITTLEDEVVRRRILQLDRLNATDPSLPTENRLLDEVLARWADDSRTATKRLTSLHDRLRQSSNRDRISEVLAKLYYQEAESLRERGEKSAAYAKYRLVVDKHSDADVAASCRERCSEAEDSIRAGVEKLKSAGRLTDAIRFLRKGADQVEPRTKRMWLDLMTETLESSLAAAEDAARNGDDLERRRVLTELESAFDHPRELEAYRQQFYRKESVATRMYREALRIGRAGNPTLAKQQFGMIVQLYPRTEAAEKARGYVPIE